MNRISGTEAYDNDPCCNYLTGWNITCIPRLINSTFSVSSVNQGLVNDQCANPDCVGSFLEVPWALPIILRDRIINW